MTTQSHFFRNLFRRPRLAGLLCGASLAVAQFFSPASVGTAQAATPNCTLNGATQNCTLTFAYTGAAETWTVPAGVTQATFELYGAQGGNTVFLGFVEGVGGAGGKTTATLSVQSGASYQINVGGQGQFTPNSNNVTAVGGFNGGGNSGSDGFSSAGGGASDIRTGNDSLTERVLVAGGGGGVGADCGSVLGGNGGAGGGISGDAGAASGSGDAGGEGGAQDKGGQIGGSFGIGGAGSTAADAGGGGGGGGYFGGGGGSAGCGGGGGGGGSSYGPAGVAFQTGVRTGNGQVIISYAILLDTTSPVANPMQSPAANVNGWNNSNVTVNWNWSDEAGGSGLDAANCPMSSLSSGEGTLTLNVSCKDLAGNEGSASYTVKVDKSAPTISAAATSSPNGNGWYNSNVTVHFACADALSGLATNACPADQVLSSEGAAVASTAQTVTDLAGNTSAASNVVTVKIDKTAPVVTVTGVSNGASYILGSAPAAGCSTSDVLSGVATQAILSVTGGNPDGTGSFIATCSGATDNAGNSNSASVTYSVVYNWTGFLQPVDNLPVINTVNAGQAIPLKFSLGGNYGLNIFASGYPAAQPVNCGTGSSTGPLTPITAPGNSGLQYDATTQTYSYVWKSDKAWAGTCRTLVVKLVDGSKHSALFQFSAK